MLPQKKPSAQQQIAQLRKQIYGIAPPVKSIYESIGQSIGSTFVNKQPNYPALGGTSIDRLGQTIKITSLELRYMFTVSNSDTYDTCRCTIVQYLDSNAISSLAPNALDNTFDPLGAASYPWLCPFNTIKKGSYRVLYDRLHHVNENGNAELGATVTIMASQLAVDKLVFTDDTGGQGAPLEEGQIVAWFVSNSTASPNPDMEGVWRLNFTDT